MLENHSRGPRRLWARIALSALLLLPADRSAWASYKICLKSGKVVEAKTKPVSMEGFLHFTAEDGHFEKLSVNQVDLEQTEKLNAVSPAKRPIGKILTNDDLSIRSSELPRTGVSLTARPANQRATSKKEAVPPQEEKRGETYWRNRARQIRDQTAAVDSEIRKLDENVKSGKADGIQIGYGTTTQYLEIDLQDQRKKLEKDKQDLEVQMRALEEEARREGVIPGWLR